MKGFTSILVVALAYEIAATSIIPGHSEREPLEHVAQFHSGFQPVSPTNSDSSLLTTCNGVLNTTTGGISYKAFEPIAANERCVWTIRGGNAGGFSLNVFSIGSLGSRDTQVIATCLRHRENATHVLVNETGPVSGVGTCNVLVITLASGSDINNATGFVLEYSVLTAGYLSSSSRDYILNGGDAAIIPYPSTSARYESYELTTFAILPVPDSRTNVLYIKGELDGLTCWDTLAFIRFNASSTLPTKWQNEGRLCGNVLSEIMSNNDLILLTFDSDMSVVGTGFNLAVTASVSSTCSL
ncbi:unnamed protein product [Orchesella dallaii]|uniref:CUB domain-containing protein n=1 Tax=Orchesella dallaii TaxID=48710 RepID=A0ABP1S0B0_9HEXA